MRVALEEGFLPGRCTDPVHGLAGVGESQTEQRAGDQFAAQPDRNLTEVDLGLPPRQVFLRDECVGGFPTRFDPDLAAPDGDVLAHHPVRHLDGVMFVQEAVEDPLRGVPLLPRGIQIATEPAVDDGPVRVQAGAALRRCLSWFRPGGVQCGRDGAVSDPVLALQSAVRHPGTGIAADRCVQRNARTTRTNAQPLPSASHRGRRCPTVTPCCSANRWAIKER